MSFKNREEAARRLAGRLRSYKDQHPLILAIPRGALPMGKILAEELNGELDVVLVHKLGAPGNPEYAIGAIGETGDVALREELGIEVPPSYVEKEKQRQLAVLRDRRDRYTPERPPIDPQGRVVIVVDDGIATGATFRAALMLVRARQPRKLIAAIGVAPPDSLAPIRDLADEVICLEAPRLFFAVSQFFEDFRQIEDREVIRILREARKREAASAAASVELSAR